MTHDPLQRYEALLHEDLVVPMHHHTDDRRDTLVAGVDGETRAVTPEQAGALVAEQAPTRALTEVDHVDDGPWRVRRRHVLGGMAAGFGGLLASSWLPRYSFAAPTAGTAAVDQPLLVVIFCRGGMDGLQAVVPTGDPAYYRARPTLGVRPEQTIALGGGWGLNRNMAALKPLWDSRELAIIHGAGHPRLTRSHFEDEITVELAAPANMRSGWVGRHLQSSSATQGTFRAITVGNRATLSLTTTAFNTLALNTIASYDLTTWRNEQESAAIRTALDKMYARSGGMASTQAASVFQAIGQVSGERTKGFTNRTGFPEGAFGEGMAEIGRLGSSALGVEVACIDLAGWDMHLNMGSAADPAGWYSKNARQLAEGIAALKTALGPRWARTTVVTMSEFGRRVVENGTGTDHGQGNVMFIAGGGIRGGRLHQRVPSLEAGNLSLGDVPVGIDYRQPLAEIVRGRLGNAKLDQVFPGFTPGADLGLV